jgi:hypothetical protein
MPTWKALESLDEYTVGWISALSLELAAATTMFNEEHGQPVNFESLLRTKIRTHGAALEITT